MAQWACSPPAIQVSSAAEPEEIRKKTTTLKLIKNSNAARVMWSSQTTMVNSIRPNEKIFSSFERQLADVIVEDKEEIAKHNTSGALMHTFSHEFVDLELEKEYRKFYASEDTSRVYLATLSLFILSVGLLIRSYAMGGGWPEILCLHVLNITILLTYLQLAKRADKPHAHTITLLLYIVGSVSSCLAMFFLYEKEQDECLSESTEVARLLCEADSNRGLVVGCGVTAILLVGSVVLRRFLWYLAGASVTVLLSILLFVWVQPFPDDSGPFIIIVLILAIVLGLLNRGIDMLMRRDFMWYTDTANLTQHYVGRMDRAKRHRERIVAYLFHEVRNPINNIALASQATQATLDDANKRSAQDMIGEARAMSDIVTEATPHATRVLDDALDLEKLAAGNFTFTPSVFTFGDLYQPVVLALGNHFRKKGVNLIVKISHTLESCSVCGDSFRLKQVLQNFLTNALRVSSKNSDVVLRIGLLKGENKKKAMKDISNNIDCVPVRVSVSDSGPGLGRQQREILFKPWSHLKVGDEAGTSGLGLSLNKDFVKRGHNGTIGVDSPGDLGPGCTFFFDIAFPMISNQPIQGGLSATETMIQVGSKAMKMGEGEAPQLSPVVTQFVPLVDRSRGGRYPRLGDRETGHGSPDLLERHNQSEDRLGPLQDADPVKRKNHMFQRNGKKKGTTIQIGPTSLVREGSLKLSLPFAPFEPPKDKRRLLGNGPTSDHMSPRRLHSGPDIFIVDDSDDEDSEDERTYRFESEREDGKIPVPSKPKRTQTTSEGSTIPSARPDSDEENKGSQNILQTPAEDLSRHSPPTPTMTLLVVPPHTGGDGKEPMPTEHSGVAETVEEMPCTALVVEDSAIARKLMVRALDKINVVADTAEDGQIGVDKACQREYDIIFMDKEMPVMDGCEATKILRAKGMTVPIIAVTANTQPHQIEEFLTAGATELCPKPVNVATLRKVLQRHVVAWS